MFTFVKIRKFTIVTAFLRIYQSFLVMKFSSQLQKIMHHFKLSTTEMADKINVPKATISHLISERNKPSLEFITKVHTTFPSINLEWLIYAKEPFLMAEKNSENNVLHPSPTYDLEKKSYPEIAIADENLTTNNENSSEKLITNEENILSFGSKKIDSIVIFYNDGSFKQYQP